MNKRGLLEDTKSSKTTLFWLLFLIVLLLLPAPPGKTGVTHAPRKRLQEGYPLSVIHAIRNHRSQISAAATKKMGGPQLQSVIRLSKKWKPGETVTLAF